MPQANSDFPKPQPGDAAGVVSALETGRAEWARGELREAVRWVHRAADAAESAGNDVRAVGLARVAADMMSSLEVPTSSSPSPPRDEGAALAPFDDFNDQTLVDAPALLAVRQALQSSVRLETRSGRQSDPLFDTALSVEPTPQPARRRTAVRVAVSQTPAGDGSLSVRVLPDGAGTPSGSVEALLVMLDPDATLPARVDP